VSTIQYASSPTTNDNKGSKIIPPEGDLRLESDYESDPDPTRHAYCAFDDLSHKSDTEILNQTTSPLPSKPMLSEEARESIAHVKGFEQNKAICVRTHGPHLVARTVST